MFIRRLTTSACALALIIPAAAGAQQADHIFPQPVPEKTHTVYGDTKYDLQNKQDLGSPTVKGDTKNDIIVPAGKSAGAIASLTDKQLPAAYGGRLHAAHVTAAGATDDGPDGWQIAAVAEAGLLAAFALGAATFVGRMRPRRGATA
jgi:hypothetical protein